MLSTTPPALLAASPRSLVAAELSLQPAPLHQPAVPLQPDVPLRPGTTRWIAANGSTSWPSAAVAQRASGWGHARDIERLRMALPPPAKLSRLQERLRTSLLAERNSTAATRRRLVRPAGRRHGDAAMSRHSSQAPRRRASSLPAGNALIALHGATSTMPSDQILFAEEISCVYTKQNCTCDFDCPCELNGDDGREALWCGCEQIFNCTCEMRSGACTVGPPDDAYLFFPGQQTGSTGGYLAALRGDALDFGGNASFAVEAWARPHKHSADEAQTLVSRYNNDVAGQWIVYLDHAKRAPPPSSPPSPPQSLEDPCMVCWRSSLARPRSLDLLTLRVRPMPSAAQARASSARRRRSRSCTACAQA